MFRRNQIIRTILFGLLLVALLTPALYSAGSKEVETRDLERTEPFASLDLPYRSELSLMNNLFSHTYDFTQRQSVQYRYTESIRSEERDPVSGMTKVIGEENRADMEFAVTGLGFADIIYHDMLSRTTKVLTDTDNSLSTDASGTFGPETVRHDGYKPDGTYNFDPNLHFSYMLQFPITNRELRMGSTVTVDLPMPVRFNGYTAEAPGAIEMTYVGNVVIDGRSYAKLLSQITFDESGLPSDATGSSFSLTASGFAVHYFDLARKLFYYGNIELDAVIETAALTPDFSKFRDPSADIPGRTIETSVRISYQMED